MASDGAQYASKALAFGKGNIVKRTGTTKKAMVLLFFYIFVPSQ
jgi:hypothetical protein